MAFRNLSLSLIVAGLGFCGCSKKEAIVQTGVAEKSSQKQGVDPQISANLTEVSKKMDARQYDEAVGTLAALKGVPKSEAEQQEYSRRLQQTIDMLNERAAAGDERAAASYKMLGRFVTGR
jgi:hypothetical protein